MKKSIFIGAAILGILMWSGVGIQENFQSVAEASYENPYTHMKYMKFRGDEEKVYIEKKTTALFRNRTAAIPEEYVTPEGWKREQLLFNNIPVERFAPEQVRSDNVVLFLHGGAYIGGLSNRYRDWGVNLAELAGHAEMLAVDYRLAPKHKHPAALEDAVAAYEGILAKGYSPDKIILMGDSAGGNLAAALLVALRDKQKPLPKRAVLISPWTSFSNQLPSRIHNNHKDKILGVINKSFNHEVLEPGYGKGVKVTDPYLSPVYADLSGLPKMLIVAGSDELLIDDTMLFSQYAKNYGVDVTTKIYAGMSHDWTLLLPELPETKAMFKDIAKFVNKSM